MQFEDVYFCIPASDYEPSHGLQRAMSCDSVASDISVMELEPEAPKVGQLEFGLEYDRCRTLIIHSLYFSQVLFHLNLI